MQQSVVRILDVLVPPDIKEFEQTEELARARALVFLLLINLLSSILALLGSLAVTLPPAIANNQTRIGLILCTASYFFTLLHFKRTALFTLCGNAYATTAYITILTVTLTLPGPGAVFFVLSLFALPLLVAPIVNHASSIIWTAIVASTPLILNYFGEIEVSQLFRANWILACTGIFLTLYIGHELHEGMSRRLNTERSKFEFAAAHDSLTGLANRSTFEQRLRQSIDLCTLHGSKAVFVYIDLDKFKAINDTYGHQAGDIVLVTVAERLRHLVRRFDTVARLGGDEFAILFDQCSLEGVKHITDRIAEVIKEPITAFNKQLFIDCSIGLVVCPDDGLRPEQLTHKADARMYQAKRNAETKLPVANLATSKMLTAENSKIH